jgi:hypothetical protein
LQLDKPAFKSFGNSLEQQTRLMNSAMIAALVFACLFGAGLLGVRIRAMLPEDHQNPETKDAVKVGMGLVATMAALVLGLLVASTKGAYDTQKSEVTQMAAKIVFLDRVLANYGSESAESRDLLRRSVESAMNRMWPDKKSSQAAQLDPSVSSGEGFFNSIQKLSPQNDVQRSLKAQATQIATDLGQMRWLLFEQTESSISLTMLIVLICWLAVIFISAGLFAPPNATVVVALMLAALSVAGAIFLIMELDMPFDGVIQISQRPMQNALIHLGH